MLASDIMVQISVWTMAGSVGGVILTMLIFFYTVGRNINKGIESKVDKDEYTTQITKIDNEMSACAKSKASCTYVDDKVRVLHHRIDDNSSNVNKQLTMLIEEQRETRKEVSSILKLMAKS